MVAAYRRGTFGTGVVRGNGLALQQSGVVSLGAVAIPADTNFASNVLLTKTNTVNASTNTTFLDSSTNNFTITRNGTPTQGSVNPYWPNGQWSNYFDGSGDYLITPTVGSITGNFTVEMWYYPEVPTNTWYPYLFGSNNPYSSSGGIGGYYDTQTGVADATSFYLNVASGNILVGTFGNLKNKWNHIALCRSGSTISGFLNGSLLGTTITNSSTIATTTFYIGGLDDGGSFDNHAIKGYISNFRLVKGTAVYTSSFTPPTTPLTAITNTSLLTCQSNRFLDNSTNAFAITASGPPKVQAFQPFPPNASYITAAYGASGYFNGSTDYLSLADNAALQLSTGDFTIEGWFYISGATSTAYNLISKGTSSTGWSLNTTTGARIQFSYTASNLTGATTTLVPSAWYHIAVVRSGSATGNLKIYLNGVQEIASAGAVTDNFNQTDLMYISASRTATLPLNGYSSNVRVVKGTAVYTATFTPPTTPLTAIANTSLLANFTNAGIYDSTAQNDAITTGTAQVSTTQFKWSPTSMKFNGTSDYLTTPSNPALALRTGDFTVEFWMYPTAAQTGDIVDTRVSGDSANSWCVQLDSTNIHFTGVGSNYLSYPYTINTWTHVAYTRVSGSVSVYINGTKYGSSVTLTNDFTGTVYRIGATFNNFYYAGYIQDLRVTKGLARYTANFTAPTTTFSNGPTTYTPAVPDAPIIANITTVTDTSVKIGYMAPLLNGGSTITSYTAVSSPGGYTGTSVTSRSGTITVSGLGYANTYTFAVYATNAIGTSTYSASTKSITTPLSLGRIFILADMDLALTDLVMLNTSIAGSSKAKTYALATIYGSD